MIPDGVGAPSLGGIAMCQDGTVAMEAWASAHYWGWLIVAVRINTH